MDFEIAVDPEDSWLLEKYNWHFANGYARRDAKCSDGKYRKLYLHRLILGLQFGDKRDGDHINGNKLDNRRSNLRVCTRQENSWNQHNRKKSKSKYRGVERISECSWRAAICFNGKRKHLGCFDSPEKAYKAYLKEAKRLHKEFFYA